MFVYQNKSGYICVTFKDTKPVENPEYVIAIDKDAKTLYMISGEIDQLPVSEQEITTEEVEEKEIPETDIEEESD